MTLYLAEEQKKTISCEIMDIEEQKPQRFWLFKWLFNWTSASPTMLRNVEKKLLSYLKTPYRGFFVDIGPAIGEADKVWTISLNSESKETPLVMLHGLGAGVALWVMNLDALSRDRPVYAMDTLGFGRSSRPQFSSDPLICEKQLVKSVEEWRREMNINNMILLGHSMGGFIASSYALNYPDRVKHLILADPWGFPEKPPDSQTTKQIPVWVRTIAFFLTPLNPLWALRAAGPFGQWVVQKTRPDITRKFAVAVEEDDVELVPQYIHQCNAQKPSGESAFHTMMESFGWAKNPMVKRLPELRADIPITFVYGSRSWIDSSSGDRIKSSRGSSMVDIKVVTGAGHHVYADKPEVFNRYVNEICERYTQNKVVQSQQQQGNWKRALRRDRDDEEIAPGGKPLAVHHEANESEEEHDIAPNQRLQKQKPQQQPVSSNQNESSAPITRN